jgi:hypothetical protein
MSTEAAYFDAKQLMEMTDEKLYALERSTKSQIEAQRRKGIDVRSREVEYCYLRRELDHRTTRRNVQRKLDEQKLKKKNMEGGMKTADRPGRPMSPQYRERMAR